MLRLLTHIRRWICPTFDRHASEIIDLQLVEIERLRDMLRQHQRNPGQRTC
jgi:hypothetical protein